MKNALTVARRIAELPSDWHGAGCLSGAVIDAIAEYASDGNFRVSVETGVGKSTLILSHCSDHHIAFAADFGDSLNKTMKSPLLAPGKVQFVEGFCQETVPRYDYPDTIDFALIDGAHGYPFPELDYYVFYPLLREGSILAVDDIHIPTINNLFNFLYADDMFELDRVIGTTAFFVRSNSPTFDPKGDGWSQQGYNRDNYPISIVDESGIIVPYTRSDSEKPF